MRTICCVVALSCAGFIGPAIAVTVSHDDCARVVRHVPAPDVAYTPGRDVDGNPVVPADLEGGIRIEPLSEINIPITIDLQDRFGIPANNDLFEAEAHVGTVTRADGKTFFNGQKLSSEDEATLIAACREALRGKR